MVLIEVGLPPSVSIETIELSPLLKGWDAAIPIDPARVIGTESQLRGESAVLSIPSAIVLLRAGALPVRPKIEIDR